MLINKASKIFTLLDTDCRYFLFFVKKVVEILFFLMYTASK